MPHHRKHRIPFAGAGSFRLAIRDGSQLLGKRNATPYSRVNSKGAAAAQPSNFAAEAWPTEIS
jgi:hypothetical protein